jgi:hypothetical protein
MEKHNVLEGIVNIEDCIGRLKTEVLQVIVVAPSVYMLSDVMFDREGCIVIPTPTPRGRPFSWTVNAGYSRLREYIEKKVNEVGGNAYIVGEWAPSNGNFMPCIVREEDRTAYIKLLVEMSKSKPVVLGGSKEEPRIDPHAFWFNRDLYRTRQL